MNEPAEIHSIVIIESLPENERKTGKELYDDIVVRYVDLYKKEETIQHEYHHVQNGTELLELLENINSNLAAFVPGLFIHIEAHGSDDRTGMSLADSSTLPWQELRTPFRDLNVGLNNELYLSMATCYGRGLHETLDFKKKSPFRAFISANTEVNPVEILESYEPLFQRLIESGDLIHAINDLKNNGDHFHYKDSIAVWQKALKISFSELDKIETKKGSFIAVIIEQVKADTIATTRENFDFGK